MDIILIITQTCLIVLASKEEYDTTGKTTYKEACKQCGVIPVSYFLRHMQDTELIMRHHGLGAAGAKAIAISLVVSFDILCCVFVDKTGWWLTLTFSFCFFILLHFEGALG